jgi:hypothetical protein
LKDTYPSEVDTKVKYLLYLSGHCVWNYLLWFVHKVNNGTEVYFWGIYFYSFLHLLAIRNILSHTIFERTLVKSAIMDSRDRILWFTTQREFAYCHLSTIIYEIVFACIWDYSVLMKFHCVHRSCTWAYLHVIPIIRKKQSQWKM